MAQWTRGLSGQQQRVDMQMIFGLPGSSFIYRRKKQNKRDGSAALTYRVNPGEVWPQGRLAGSQQGQLLCPGPGSGG